MKYLDLTLPRPADNVALDEALLDACEENSSEEILRFWEPAQSFVVVGYANKVALEVNMQDCQERGVPVLRRFTGGGTVVQGPGCLNYTLALCINRHESLSNISGTNRHILQQHVAALAPLLDGPVKAQGHTDLTWRGLKFSGNSQRRKRRALLFHGTFLLHFDLPLIERLLPLPSQQPDYRRNRSHADFLTNLPLAPETVKTALWKIWNAEEPYSPLPIENVARLAAEKYDCQEWNLKY